MKVNLLPHNILDIDSRIYAFIADYDAYDPATGAYMWSSKGRRKPGRPTKYYATFLDTTVRFTAHRIDDAIKIANRKLSVE